MLLSNVEEHFIWRVMVHVSQLSVLDMSSTLMEETFRENNPRLQTG
jgi:hypothetical protein